MVKDNENERNVWSYSLCRLPEEDESARLEEVLREQKLPFWEDAEALRRFISLRNLSQSACAALLGRSQASVANRLRVLKLPEDVRRRMRAHSLTERHARALLRLKNPGDQRRALETILRRNLNVAQTEAYVEEQLSQPQGAQKTGQGVFDPLLAELERLRGDVPGISFALRETDSDILFLISIPKNEVKDDFS